MSYRVISVNSQYLDSDDLIDLGLGTTVFSWRKITPNSLNIGTLQHGTSKNTPLYQNSTYIDMDLGTGVSVDRSSFFPLSSTAVNWFDEISLPEGDYELRHNFSGSNQNPQTGKVAWVNNVTSSRIGPIMSFRDARRSNISRISFTAPSGGIKIALRILEASISIMSYDGVRATSIVIIKRG